VQPVLQPLAWTFYKWLLRWAAFSMYDVESKAGPVAQRLEQRTHKPDHFSDLF
jgi:hypothetical protein